MDRLEDIEDENSGRCNKEYESWVSQFNTDTFLRLEDYNNLQNYWRINQAFKGIFE